MILKAQNLPKAYFQPKAALPVEKQNIPGEEQVRKEQSPRIIDAEWQQVAPPPAYRSAPRFSSPALFVDLEKPPGAGANQARAAERYRSMNLAPGLERGALLDISA